MIAPRTHDRAFELHEAALRVLRRRSAIDLELGETLVALFEGDRLLRLGYAKQSDYGRERLGLPVRTVRQFTRLARGLAERPILRGAVAGGEVSMRKALLVMEVATGEFESAWTTAAAHMTEKELRARIHADGGKPPEEPFDVETVILRMNPEQQDRLDRGIEVANVVMGNIGRRWRAVEVIAMEWAAGHAKWWPEEEEEVRPDDGTAEVLPEWGDEAAEGDLRGADRLADREPLPTDPFELDSRARRLAEERGSYDLEFGPILMAIYRDRLWRDLGYRGWEEYVTEGLGVSVRTVRQRLWLERRMDELPALRTALRRRILTYTKVLFVAADATPDDVDERIATAASTTCQQAERDSTEKEDRQNRAAGIRRLWGPRDAFETLSMAITAAQRQFRAAGEIVAAGEVLARMADHFVSVWAEDAERIRKKTPRRRREVLARHGGYCAFPGCTRPAEHDHHVWYRSRGGSNAASNRVGLCAAHHLRAIHRGRAFVRGRAGERLTWEFGSGERFVTVGDDEVTREEVKQRD